MVSNEGIRWDFPQSRGHLPLPSSRGAHGTVLGATCATVPAVAVAGVPAAGFTVSSATSITATVSSTATTGPISVTTPGGTAASAGSFVVLATQDLQVSVLPATLLVPAAGQAAFW